MTIYYKQTLLNRGVGLIWLVVTLLNVIQVAILWGSVFIIFPAVIAVLAGFIAQYMLWAHKKVYIHIEDHTLYVQKSMIHKAKIDLDELTAGNIIKDKLFLWNHDKKEHTIRMNVMSIYDSQRLINHLSSIVEIQEGYSGHENK